MSLSRSATTAYQRAEDGVLICGGIALAGESRRRPVGEECTAERVAEEFLSAEGRRGFALAFAPTPTDAVSAFDACGHPLLLRLRPDGWATCRAILKAFARWYDRPVAAVRGHLLSSPTHEVIAREAGCSVRTVSRYVRLMRRIGFMVTVVPGRVRRLVPEGVRLEDLTAEAIAALEREHSAAVYLLTMPYELLEYTPSYAMPLLDEVPVDIDGDPEHLSVSTSSPLAEAMDRPSHWLVISGFEWSDGEKNCYPEKTARGARRSPPVEWHLSRVPHSRSERLQAISMLQNRVPVLRHAAMRDLHALLRAFFQSGWTPFDVLHALDQRPDGVRHLHTAQVRHAAGWLAARLRFWMTELVVGVSYSQRVLAEREATMERQRTEAVARAAEEQLLAIEAATSMRTSLADHVNNRCWKLERCSWCESEVPAN